MLDEAADNKLLKLLKQKESASEEPNESPEPDNRLLRLLREKASKGPSGKRPETSVPPANPQQTVPPSANVHGKRAHGASQRGARQRTEAAKPGTEPAEGKRRLAPVPVVSLLGSQELDTVRKVANDPQLGWLRHFFLVQSLMGSRLRDLPPEDKRQKLLQEYVHTQKSALNRLLIHLRLNKDLDFEKLTDETHESLLLQLRTVLLELLSSPAPPRPFETPEHKVSLLVSLNHDAVSFLERLISEKGRLGLLRHLIFSTALVGHEVVTSKDGAEPLRQVLGDLLRRYTSGQKAFLNKLLVQVRMGKKPTPAHTPKELDEILPKIVESLGYYIGEGIGAP